MFVITGECRNPKIVGVYRILMKQGENYVKFGPGMVRKNSIFLQNWLDTFFSGCNKLPHSNTKNRCHRRAGGH